MGTASRTNTDVTGPVSACDANSDVTGDIRDCFAVYETINITMKLSVANTLHVIRLMVI